MNFNCNWVKIFLFFVLTNLFNLTNSIAFKNLLNGEKIEFFGIHNDVKNDSLVCLKYDVNKNYILDDRCCYIIATSNCHLISEFINIVNQFKYERWNSFRDLDFLDQYKEKFVKLDIRFFYENEEFEKFLKQGFLCSERNEDGELILTKFGPAHYRNPYIPHVKYLSKRIVENNICLLNHQIDLLIKSLKKKEDLKKRNKLESKLKEVNQLKKELDAIEKSILSNFSKK